ncbi:MAG: site-2 protease family protein [Oligoflexia bacterium]|nr:site-2 protease family protein [Oligoflexia bacterium]
MKSKLFRMIFILSASLSIAACTTNQKSSSSDDFVSQSEIDSPAAHTPSVPLIPVARSYSGDNTPIVKHFLLKSVAEKSGVRVGDKVLSLNGYPIITAAEFDKKIKRAPKNSTIVVLRGNNKIKLNIVLSDKKPRFGAGFEPSGVVFTKKNSPYIGVIHLKNMTVYAQASATTTNELRFNFIIESHVIEVAAPVKFSIHEKGDKKPLISGSETIDALGAEPHVFSKVIPNDGDLKLPIRASLNISKNNFLFEFQ